MVNAMSKKLHKPTVQGRFVRMTVYGPNRVGKSTFAGSAAEVFSTLYLETNEGGSDSLVRFGYKPDVLRITDIKELNDVFWGLYSGELKSSEGNLFEAIVFDDVGELQKRTMDTLMGVSPSAGGARQFIETGKDAKFPQRREWGVTTELMRKVIRYFNDLPMHLIWTAQDRMFTDPKNGNVIRIGPDLSPALSADLSNASKIIGYMMAKVDQETEEVHRYLVVSTAELNGVPVVAGQRMGLREEIKMFVDPTFKDIYEAVLTERAEEVQQTSSKRRLASRREEE
jgi:hypothetical protein